MVPSGHLLKSQALQNCPPEELEKLNTILLSLPLPTLRASSAYGPWSVKRKQAGRSCCSWMGPPRAWGYLLSWEFARAPAGRWLWGHTEGSSCVFTFCLTCDLVMFRGCPSPGGGWPLRGTGQAPTLIPGSLWAVVDAMNLNHVCFAHRPSVWDSLCSSVVVAFMSRGAGRSQWWEGKGRAQCTSQLIISLLKWA